MTPVGKTRAAELNRLHGEIAGSIRTTLTLAMEAGDLLAQQKAALPHGEFTTWVDANCAFDLRTAQRYMRAHANRDQIKSDTVSSLTDVYRLLTEPAAPDPTNSNGFDLLYQRWDIKLPGGIVVTWDGPEIMREPLNVAHAFTLLLKNAMPAILESNDIKIVVEFRDILLLWAQGMGSSLIDIEARIGELSLLESDLSLLEKDL